MQIVALPFPQLPYGFVERGPQRQKREVKKKKGGGEGDEEGGRRNETTSRLN